MRAHIVKDGVVINTIMVDQLGEDMVDADAYGGGIGWVFDGSSITKPINIIADREDARLRMKKARDEAINAPINNIQVATAEDRDNVKGSIDYWETLLGNPADINWTMADNTIEAKTKTDLEAALQGYVVRKATAHAIYQGLIDIINTTDDPRNVVWPDEI